MFTQLALAALVFAIGLAHVVRAEAISYTLSRWYRFDPGLSAYLRSAIYRKGSRVAGVFAIAFALVMALFVVAG